MPFHHKPPPRFQISQPVIWEYRYYVLRGTDEEIDLDDECLRPEDIEEIIQKGTGYIIERAFPADWECDAGIIPQWAYLVRDPSGGLDLETQSWFDEDQLESLSEKPGNYLPPPIVRTLHEQPVATASNATYTFDFAAPIHPALLASTCTCCRQRLLDCLNARQVIQVQSLLPPGQ